MQQVKRTILLNLFSQALSAVNGQKCVSHFLHDHSHPTQKLRVIAIGKAASSMMRGVLETPGWVLDAGLVITKEGHTEPFTTECPIQQLESAHPFPDQRSLDAGQALLAFIHASPLTSALVFLISGGTSALVEVLPDGISAQQLHDFNLWLLARGWPIDVMNRLRKSISLIKAGRLARALEGRQVLQLLISDVPADDPAVIGSGLLVPDPHKDERALPLPAWLQEMQADVPVPPDADDPIFDSIETHIIANNTSLRAAAASAARAAGLEVQINARLEGDAEQQARRIARWLHDGPPGVYLWGGETLVRLPEQPGRGGRCQQLALAVACEISGARDLYLLAAGSDGTDGPGDVAGALVDGQTLQRGRDGGAGDPQQMLQKADAGSFLAASGDLIDTGPTGTNVMDLVIGLKI